MKITERHKNGAVALFVGCVLNYTGDRLLGVNMELFHGLATFSFTWFLDVFVLPFLVGVAVSIIYGKGGKWLAYFPPLVVRLFNYWLFASYTLYPPEGAHLMPMGWWGFFVILAIESSGIGGIIGEVVIKSTYGRRPRELVYKVKESKEK